MISFHSCDVSGNEIPHAFEIYIFAGRREYRFLYQGCSIGFFLVKTGDFNTMSDRILQLFQDENIKKSMGTKARKRAEDLLSQQAFDTTEYATIAAKLEKELARLHVVRKHRNRIV